MMGKDVDVKVLGFYKEFPKQLICQQGLSTGFRRIRSADEHAEKGESGQRQKIGEQRRKKKRDDNK